MSIAKPASGQLTRARPVVDITTTVGGSGKLHATSDSCVTGTNASCGSVAGFGAQNFEAPSSGTMAVLVNSQFNALPKTYSGGLLKLDGLPVRDVCVLPPPPSSHVAPPRRKACSVRVSVVARQRRGGAADRGPVLACPASSQDGHVKLDVLLLDSPTPEPMAPVLAHVRGPPRVACFGL